MELPDWVPDGVEVTVPNAARMYDYALGGYHNFAVDREYVERAEALAPGAIATGHATRGFVGRGVRWLVDAGVRQFLDIGSGIPTLGNVHEVAQRVAPESRVMYVDIDPIAVAHSRAILKGNVRAGVIQADVRNPDEILYHPDVMGLLDFSQPVAVLLNAVLHFVSDADDPHGIVATLRDELVRDSYVTITHGTVDVTLTDAQESVTKLYDRTPTQVWLRRHDQVLSMLDGLEVVEPGLVPVTSWHPDPDEADDPEIRHILAAIARKP